MSKNQPDLRVRRTQKMLREALIALVVENGFDEITVQMLADHAMINRATFYRHYSDKYDLAEKVYGEMAAEYSASLQSARAKTPLDLFQLLFEHVAEYQDFFSGMLRSMPQFQSWVRRSIEAELRQIFVQSGGVAAELPIPLDVILRYLSHAQIGVVQWWLESGQPLPTNEVANALMRLHVEGGFKQLGFDQLLADMS